MTCPDTAAPTHVVTAAAASPPFKLSLKMPHVLIKRMLEPAPKPDAYGYVRQNAAPGVDVRVSKLQRKLALIIMDRLFKTVEQRGWTVEIETYQGHGTFVIDGRDRAQVWIEEKQRQVEHVPTPKELKQKETWPHTRLPKWDKVYTGELVLHPGGPVDATTDRSVSVLIAKAIADLQNQLARARQGRETEEARRNEESRQERARQQEKARLESFHNAARALHDYRVAVDYIEEVRRFGRVPQDQRREGQSLDQWLEWAERQARRSHPLG
jgi:hypothetical protein